MAGVILTTSSVVEGKYYIDPEGWVHEYKELSPDGLPIFTTYKLRSGNITKESNIQNLQFVFNLQKYWLQPGDRFKIDFKTFTVDSFAMEASDSFSDVYNITIIADRFPRYTAYPEVTERIQLYE
jgi:hypothetical protein